LGCKTQALSFDKQSEEITDYKPQTEFKKDLKKVYKWFTENGADLEKNAEF